MDEEEELPDGFEIKRIISHSFEENENQLLWFECQLNGSEGAGEDEKGDNSEEPESDAKVHWISIDEIKANHAQWDLNKYHIVVYYQQNMRDDMRLDYIEEIDAP